MKVETMFPEDEPHLEQVEGELVEKARGVIKSKGGSQFIIDSLYREAFRTGLEALTDSEGNCRLTIYAEKGKKGPRLLPTAEDEKVGGPFTWPLARIIHDAQAGEQVERLSKKGDLAMDFTISNTRVEGGKKGNEPTRQQFVAYIRKHAGDGAAIETLKKLTTADALLRPDANTTTVEIER